MRGLYFYGTSMKRHAILLEVLGHIVTIVQKHFAKIPRYLPRRGILLFPYILSTKGGKFECLIRYSFLKM
jgi:hypothetical protein